MNEVRIGMLGFGRIGRLHARKPGPLREGREAGGRGGSLPQ